MYNILASEYLLYIVWFKYISSVNLLWVYLHFIKKSPSWISFDENFYLDHCKDYFKINLNFKLFIRNCIKCTDNKPKGSNIFFGKALNS